MSRRDLGYGGLAQSQGSRTPEILVQRTAGISARDARTLVRVGTMMIDTADAAAGLAALAAAGGDLAGGAAQPSDAGAGAGAGAFGTDPSAHAEPWLAGVSAAASSGRLSLDAADVIRTGLGAPDESVDVAALTVAADELLAEAAFITVERLATNARERRTMLDAAGVRGREKLLRSRRFLHIVPQSDGMTRLSGLLDPESAAVVVAAYDAATSPRRGGPRFVDPDDVARAERITTDDRTTPQLALDTFVDLIRLATDADPGILLGSRQPAVRLLVTERDLLARTGVGHLEGQTDPVSIDTVTRHVCRSGLVPLVFDDDGRSLNLGRTQRLFSQRQRVAIAARDGGCLFPDCERPPSWSEVHHIYEWERDHGRTDVDDGVLLCRHHHLLVHNNGWRIIREGADYFAVPPRAIDSEQQPIPAPSKSPALRRLLATA